MKLPCCKPGPALAWILILSSLAAGNTNLLTNPGAETGDLTGWDDPLNQGFNIGTAAFPAAHPPYEGSFCFWAGITGPAAGAYSNEIRQDVDVSALSAAIDASMVTSDFNGRARTASSGGSSDPARIMLEFLSAGSTVLQSFDTGTVLPSNTWVLVTDVRTLPVGTRVVRVRLLGSRSAGASTDALFDALSLTAESAADVYCTAGTSASGCQASLSACGTASATAAAGFSLTATSVEGAKDGLYFFGTNGQQASPWGNGTSYQCVVPPVKRGGLLVGVGTSGACDGAFTQDLNALWCSTCPKPLHNPGAGATVQAQLWYRDPANTSNQTTSLSNAIEFTVAP